MNKYSIKTLNILRRLYRILMNQNNANIFLSGQTDDFVQYKEQQASDEISKILLQDKPCMIARVGEIEMQCLTNIYFINLEKALFRKIVDYVSNKSISFWWDDYTIKTMRNNAGFFPPTENNLQKFYNLMLESMINVDVLGSWLRQEIVFKDYLKNAKNVRFKDLEPYYHSKPWSKALEGKKVLVIHPFSESIDNQYKNRRFLFENKDILPNFELKTLKAVQSIAGNETQYEDWFEALDSMKRQICNIDFDIAIIGCGAYGFVLASYIKDIGKKAIHLGGPTQVMFGIIGKRWEEDPVVSKFINKYWVRPIETECPSDRDNVEGGCYW